MSDVVQELSELNREFNEICGNYPETGATPEWEKTMQAWVRKMQAWRVKHGVEEN